jgi:hypothetical protein
VIYEPGEEKAGEAIAGEVVEGDPWAQLAVQSQGCQKLAHLGFEESKVVLWLLHKVQ